MNLQRSGLSVDLQREMKSIIQTMFAKCLHASPHIDVTDPDNPLLKMGYEVEDITSTAFFKYLLKDLLTTFVKELDPSDELSLRESLVRVVSSDLPINELKIPKDYIENIVKLQQIVKKSNFDPSILSIIFQIIRNLRVKSIRAQGRPKTSADIAIRNQFFTPDFVSEFLVVNTIGRSLFEDSYHREIRVDSPYYIKSLPINERDLPYFDEISVLDPALGCANFFQKAIELFSSLAEDDEIRALAKNFHGYDIDPQCPYVSKIILYLTLAQNGIDTKGIYLDFKSPLDDFNKIVCKRFESISTLGFLDKDLLVQKTVHDAPPDSTIIEFNRIFGRRFDVILMNPPYGDFPEKFIKKISTYYPNSKQDFYTAFVERGLEHLHNNGLLGALTSRTAFYLKTFHNWREKCLTEKGRLITVVELGTGMMMNATVDTSCYIIQRC